MRCLRQKRRTDAAWDEFWRECLEPRWARSVGPSGDAIRRRCFMHYRRSGLHRNGISSFTDMTRGRLSYQQKNFCRQQVSDHRGAERIPVLGGRESQWRECRVQLREQRPQRAYLTDDVGGQNQLQGFISTGSGGVSSHRLISTAPTPS